MPAIIAAILAALVPVLLEWVRKWIESRLLKAAEGMPELSMFTSEDEARDAMFDRAIKALPKRAVARRALLRKVKEIAAKSGITSRGPTRPVLASDLEELAGLAGLAGLADAE